MSASQLELIVNQVKLLPPDDLVKLIWQVAELLEQKQPISIISAATSYAALFDSGRGAFATSAKADSFLRAERNQWGK
jgi:hypothetical protein